MASVGIFKDGKLVCRGAGNFSLPRSPYALCICGGGFTADGRARAAAPV